MQFLTLLYIFSVSDCYLYKKLSLNIQYLHITTATFVCFFCSITPPSVFFYGTDNKWQMWLNANLSLRFFPFISMSSLTFSDSL